MKVIKIKKTNNFLHSNRTFALILNTVLILSLLSCGVSSPAGESSNIQNTQNTQNSQISYNSKYVTKTALSSEPSSVNIVSDSAWYIIKELNLGVEVPNDLRITASKDKHNYEGSNGRIRITFKKWDHVSYPKASELAKLVKNATGRKTGVIKRGGRRIVKALGFKSKIRYYMISPNGDDYIITIEADKDKDQNIKFKDIEEDAKNIERSLCLASRVPGNASAHSLTAPKKTNFNKLVLVNYAHKLPSGWNKKIDIVRSVNTRGHKVKVERTTYKAYLKLKHDLKDNDGIDIDIDYGLRTVKEQKKIMKEYTEKYGSAYANRIVAKPGYSEHHTGLALDIYLIIDGKNIYLNEDMEKYPKTWAKIHKKLAKYGFILRYPKNGNGRVTGYAYEPWHIRYVGKKAAKTIMSKQPGYTLEMYLR